MISVVCWKWRRPDGTALFSATHVNVLRAALDKHLRLPHSLTCITDDPAGLDGDIRVVPMPERFADSPRCRRRMIQFDRDFSMSLGKRLLLTDLDMVIVGDLTHVLNRNDAIVGVKVQHANVVSGSFLLCNAGVLHSAWEPYAREPEAFPARVQAKGIPSDQAMLNYYFARRGMPPCWTEKDGFITYYGDGYQRFEHLGVGPTRKTLPAKAKLVILGSADLHVLEDPSYPWVQEHWLELAAKVGAR